MPFYNVYKASVFSQVPVTDLDSDTIKVALVTAAYAPNVDTHDFWNDVSANEAVGAGYTAGGQALASKTVTVDTVNDRGVFDAADVVWPASTVTARYLVVYKDTGVAATSALIAYYDFGADRSSFGADFSILWNAIGIFTAT